MKANLFSVVTALVAVSLSSQLIAGTPAVAKKSKSDQSAGSAAKDTGAKSSALSLKIVSITSPVKAGADATVTAQTDPDALCKIAVKLKSGAATAKGLAAQHADKTGKASWTWKVATNTAAGSWPVEVTASSKGSKASANGTLEVTK
jgi:hypothetical protein